MKKTIILFMPLIFILSLLVYGSNISYSIDSNNIELKELNKTKLVKDLFKKEYEISYNLSNKVDEELKDLTKKVTYLLIGPFNNIDETPENFYKRSQDFSNYRYQLDIPRDPNNPSKPDENSKEYLTNLGVDIFVGNTFSKFNELEILYNEYGDINITSYNNFVITSIKLNNVKMKQPNPTNPLEYIYVNTNITIHYYFLKYKDEYKIYYLYGETNEEYDEYIKSLEELDTSNNKILPLYNNNLTNIYDFTKLNSLSDDSINNIYNNNINNILFLTSYYNNNPVAFANSILINDGILLTTWDFLNKALIEGQYITARDNDNNIYEIDGIITANLDNNIVLLKLKDKKESTLKIANLDNINITDPIIVISNKLGTGALIEKGIIISKDNYLETSIPLTVYDTASPVFDISGNLLGINTSRSTNSSTSYAIPSNILIDIKNKFSSIDFSSLDIVTFEKVKESFYYIKKGEEKVVNNIPSNIWNKYSKIGNLKENIELELTKASYTDNILSLRYKNNLKQYIDGITLTSKFRQELINNGYKQILNSPNKYIYVNNQYKILILEEFDYIIIVMVSL